MVVNLQAAAEARVLVLEVAERHDIIVKLKNELNEMEQLLMQKDTHIQFKDEIIRELRQQRRDNFKVWCLVIEAGDLYAHIHYTHAILKYFFLFSFYFVYF